MSDVRCELCRYWVSDDKEVDECSAGQCNFSAPVSVWLPDIAIAPLKDRPPQGNPTFEAENAEYGLASYDGCWWGSSNGIWVDRPKTNAHDFCGQFKPGTREDIGVAHTLAKKPPTHYHGDGLYGIREEDCWICHPEKADA